MTGMAINGLGRIGRTFLKLALENPMLEIVAANDISDPSSLASLNKTTRCNSWYDNEFGFTNTLLAHVVEAARSLHATA